MPAPVNSMEATNLFGFGGNFNPQSSNSDLRKDQANIMDATGNNECETMVNERTEYTNSLAYCNATPDIKTDLATLLTKFGDVHDSKKVDSMTINFEKGAYATIDISGHNHTDNAHVAGLGDGYCDASAAIPAGSGFGVPDWGITMGDNATPISASVVFSGNHIDREGTDGNHWEGKTTTYKAELTLTIEGVPTDITATAIEADATGWTVDSINATDGNQDFDGYVFALHRYFDLAVA
jgi:hypothetical protein